jgi:hypothetical protein
MKKLGFATIAATGLAAAVLGLAVPAQATTLATAPITTISTDLDHHGWIQDIHPRATAPQVDTTVRGGR